MSDQCEPGSEESDLHAAHTNVSDRNNEDESKSEIRMTESQLETPMLEDEEMPTYISVTSPSKREESDDAIGDTKHSDRLPMEADHSRSPYPSDDQGGGSVYVLSSGEDSDNPPYNDDDEDDYGESEDIMDDMDLENVHNNVMLDDEEEEEEDEDEDDECPLRMHNDDDEDMEAEDGPECFERASDDFLLNKRLKPHHKKRGLSLQDLSVCKNNVNVPYEGRKHNLLSKTDYLSLMQNYIIDSHGRRKSVGSTKYGHVESKVKQYIKDIKEQNRRSMERRIKEQEYLSNVNSTDCKDTGTEQLNSTIHSKSIKECAEDVLPSIDDEKLWKDNRDMYSPTRVIENGDDKTAKIEEKRKYIRRDMHADMYRKSTQTENDAINVENKLEKQNGSAELTAQKYIPHSFALDKNLRFGDISDPCLTNGHQQTPTVCNLRTLTYEEYMRGSSNASQRPELSRNTTDMVRQENSENQVYNDAELISVPDIDSSNVICPLKIENVKSIDTMSEESKEYSENLNICRINQEAERENTENLEITTLKTQLSEKSRQFNQLKAAYQQLLTHGVKMKNEIDDLKKTVTKYEQENQPRETKSAAVQTDVINESVLKKQDPTNEKQLVSNKVSTSSVASSISSIGPWTESVCSSATSIKPPDLTAVLNSEDSSIVITEGTPRKTIRPLSRAFVTSSRILQTLANITSGKTKSENLLARNSKKRLNESHTEQIKENDKFNTLDSATFTPSNSKKRKVADILDISPSQPFKIPHTSKESQKTVNSTYITETGFKYPRDSVTTKSDLHLNPITFDTTHPQTPACVEEKLGQANEIDEEEINVKSFEYKEDENSIDNNFLIQADDIENGISNEKTRIRECGPYLIGNVEIRMSEVNGTVNVWGKEVSQLSTTECEDETNVSRKTNEDETNVSQKTNEDEVNLSTRSTGYKSCSCWHKTPQARFNGSPIVCSTNKKPKIAPRYSGSSIPQCSHSDLSNVMKMPFPTNDDGKQHIDGIFSPGIFNVNCETNDSPKYKDWSLYKRASRCEENTHSCCTHHIESLEKENNCKCNQEKPKYDDGSQNCSKEKLNVKEYRRCSCQSLAESSKHLQDNIRHSIADDNEPICKHHINRRPSMSNIEGNCQKDSKCCMHRDIPNTSSHENNSIYCCNRSPSNEGEEDPLIATKQSIEAAEVKHRLSGKKVRGILMDFLKGCGGCRNSYSITENKHCCAHEKEAPYSINRPKIKISPCSTPEVSYSNVVHNNERCCHAYARRIESQLEEFRMEMERVRSRSDAILDMLNMLRTVDMD